MAPKHLQHLRLFTAAIIAVLCLVGILGFFYPIKIFNINIAPLLQKSIIAFSLFSIFLLLSLLLITLLFGRIYCSTLCPLGLLQEFCLFLFHRKKLPLQKNRPIKYFIAAIAFGTLFGGSAYILRLIEPYSIFGSAFTGAAFGIIILSLIALLTTIKGRYFCTNLCPIGAVLGLISRRALYKIKINADNCVACGLCAQKCPSGCIDAKNKTVDNETCIKCFKCLNLCHNHGLSYTTTRYYNKKIPPQINLSRRRFLIASTALITFTAAYKAGIILSRNIAKKVKNIILPPGAGNAKRFANTCLNCNLCVKNCPMNIIKKANSTYPAVHIEYNKNFCSHECNKCSEICPSGAIRKLSLAAKKKTQIGLAFVNPDICIQCGLCVRECPNAAINKPQGDFPEVNPNKCIGCGACQAICPVSAIKVLPISEQKQLS